MAKTVPRASMLIIYIGNIRVSYLVSIDVCGFNTKLFLLSPPIRNKPSFIKIKIMSR